MDFNRDYLDQPIFVQRRLRRDAALRDLGVDPEEFKVWQRASEVGNECDTDEYRETQPSKGLSYIADFMADFAPGREAVLEMLNLTRQWLITSANVVGAYDGAAELVPILNACFDFMWERGGFSFYTVEELPDEGDVEYFKEHYQEKEVK